MCLWSVENGGGMEIGEGFAKGRGSGRDIGYSSWKVGWVAVLRFSLTSMLQLQQSILQQELLTEQGR